MSPHVKKKYKNIESLIENGFALQEDDTKYLIMPPFTYQL